MQPNEIMHVIETFGDNFIAGLAIGFYYLVVYWTRLKDGLGLTKDPTKNLSQLEKNYQLLQLQIEVEKAKQDSGLDKTVLAKLEQDFQNRIEQKQSPPFTSAQKFIAIPMILFFALVMLSELFSPESSAQDQIDVALGFIFFAVIIFVGFWGIPLLQNKANSKLRTVGFSVFWAFGFFLISYFILYILALLLFDWELSETFIEQLLLVSIVVSSVMGYFHKLPFMKTAKPLSPEGPN